MLFSYVKLLLLATQLTADILSVVGLPPLRPFTPFVSPSHPPRDDQPISPSYFKENDYDDSDDDIATQDDDNARNLLASKESLQEGHSTRQREQQIKRSMSMLRMGRASAPLNSAAVPDSVEALRLSGSPGDVTREKTKRAMMSMLRMGRSSDDEESERAKRAMMSMLRMGRSHDEEGDDASRYMSPSTMDRRSMAMLRLGRPSEDIYEEKRRMGMLRLGRNSPLDNDDYKRSMSMLRMG